MKTASWFAALASALGMLGCNTGSVVMTPDTPAPRNAPGSASARSSSTSISDEDPIVYFDRVTVRDALPETVVGLGFLRENAPTQNAFGLRFKTKGALSARPLLSAGTGGIIYLKPDGLGHESLLQLDPRTLSDAPLARLPEGVKVVAVSDDLRSVAWIDSGNQVTAALQGKPPGQVPFGGGLPSFLSFAPASGELEIAAISQPFVRKLHKSDDGTLASLIEQGDGTLALMATRPERGESTLIAPLAVSASVPVDHVVCPAWYGNTLYFADLSNSSYAIFSATQSGGAWTVRVFALTGESNQGFICPQVSAPQGGPL